MVIGIAITLIQCIDDQLTNFERIIGKGNKGKLISRDSENLILFIHIMKNDISNKLNDLIANVMAVKIINRFEIINIEISESERLIIIIY